MNILHDCAALVDRVRERCPLVHHLTNFVTVNDCANVTLAIGASPIMAIAPEEAGEIAALSSALVLNIGSLDAAAVDVMVAAGKCANAKNVPVVFDPVGAGASAFRRRATERILEEVKIAVVRGNISEIRSVGGLASTGKGVDADPADSGANAAQIAKTVARSRKCAVAVTGARDAISDGETVIYVDNGHPMLTKVSGTGCMCTSLVGAFVGAEPAKPLLGAAAAIMCMGIAGDMAFARAGGAGYGSFRLAVMDAISLMNGKSLLERGKAHIGHE